MNKIILIIRELDKDGNITKETEHKSFVAITEDGMISATDGKYDIGIRKISDKEDKGCINEYSENEYGA